MPPVESDPGVTVPSRLSPADAVWFLGETPVNPMIISSIMWFDRPIDRDDLVALFRERAVERHPVFRQRLVAPAFPGLPPRWEDDPDFDIDDHVTVEELPAPGDHVMVQERCSQQRTEGLDRSRPLWAWHQMNGYGDGGSVAHIRFHHSIADGWALVKLLLTLADTVEAEDVRVVDDDPHPHLHAAGHVLQRTGRTLADPRSWARLVVAAVDRLRWTARLLLPQLPERQSLIGTPSGDKRMVWDPVGIPLDEVKEVGRRHGATVNDVLMAAVAEALHEHLVASLSPAETVQMMAPVAIRGADEPLHRHLGNRIGLLPVLLPTGPMGTRQRLESIRDETLRLKRSAAPIVSWGLLSSTALLTPPVERAFHRFHQLRGTGVLTNVPGPTQPLTVCGAGVQGMLGWGGMTGHLNLSWALCSVDGRVFSGATTDTAITPDPEVLLERYLAAWQRIRSLG
jgi:diacylglycerol O-acyltransferase / wax synthase